MTTKEAIGILELYNPFLGGDDKKLLSEAIDVAIEALNHSADDSKKVSISRSQENDLISRQAAIDAFDTHADEIIIGGEANARNVLNYLNKVIDTIKALPSAQPEQRYTEEELRVFQHGISLSLLSKRSSQHWQYDEDTATEIKFLERLYEKVVADMRGEQDGRFNQQTGGD